MQILTRSHNNTNTHGNGWMGNFCSECSCPTNVLHRKEGRRRKEGENQKEREKEGRKSYWERGRKGETNNRVLSWINTRISFLLPFTPALDNKKFKIPYTDFKMKINKYILQQRQQCWNSNKHNKLLEIKSTLGEWEESYRKKM